MVFIYAADIRHLKYPKKDSEILTHLSDETQELILNSRSSQERILHLGTELLLKEVFSRHEMIESPELQKRCHFCFSHSKNILLCTFSEEKTGCSIRKLEDISKNLPYRFFTKSEKTYLKKVSEKCLNLEFYRLLTMKYSFFKMADLTFHYPADHVEIIMERDPQIYLDGTLIPCQIEEYDIPGYKISVCSKERIFAPRITFVTLSLC